jgi:hypothetical protein
VLEIEELPADSRDAAVLALDDLVVLAGGAAPAPSGAPVPFLRLVRIDAGGPVILLDERSPVPPDQLVVARANAAIVPLGARELLIAGGRAAGGPSRTTEILGDRAQTTPTRLLSTGELPFAAAAPRAVRLGDGTIFVVAQEGAAIYVSPREP